MERRHEQRQAVRLTLAVSTLEGCLGVYPASNAGPSGLFIEAPGLDLDPNEVIWLGPQASESEPSSVAALVVHRGPNGFGVMLSRPIAFSSSAPRQAALALVTT